MGGIMALPDDSAEVLECGADLARPEITTSHSPTSAEDEFSDRRDTGAPDPDEVDRAICGEFSQIWDDHSFFTPRHRPPRVRVTSVRSPGPHRPEPARGRHPRGPPAGRGNHPDQPPPTGAGRPPPPPRGEGPRGTRLGRGLL